MSAEIRVIAIALVKKESLTQATAAIRECVGPSRAEPGCSEYTAHTDVADPAKLVFIERWKSQSALELHMATAHFKKMIATLGPAMVGEFQVTTLKDL